MKAERTTTENARPNRQPAIIGAMAASLLMLAFGLSHRVLAWRLVAPTSTTAIAPDLLEQLPMQIGGWVGEDVPLDEAIVRRTDTDAHVNRRYSRGAESVSAYVGCGARTRDMMTHRPEVCYIGAGWTLTGRQSRDLPLSDGSTLPCTIFEFSRGVLETTKITVLYYYIVDGEYCRNLSDWQYRFWSVGYVAQVHIVASSQTQRADEDTRIISDFAEDSASEIVKLFDGIAKDQGADSSVRTPEEK